MAKQFVQTPAVTLYQGLSAVGTSMVITPYPRDIQTNTKLVFVDFGDNPTLTVDPKIANYEEIIEFSAITDNGNDTATLTIAGRNLIGQSPYTTTGTGKTHGAGAVVVFSDNPQMYNAFVQKTGNETVAGVKTFTSSPIVPTPSSATDAANKSYVDNGVLQGAADASTTVKGISRLAASPNVTKGTVTMTIATPCVVSFSSHGLTLNDTVQFTTTGALPTGVTASTTYYVISAGLTANAFEISATLGGSAINTSGSQSGTHTLIKTTPISVGDNDGRVPTQAENDALVGNNTDIAVGSGNKMVTQTGFQKGAEVYAASATGNDTYVVTLSPVPTSLVNGMTIRFKPDTANTGAATLNVNGLGALAIVTGLSTALATGDIVANQVCEVIYNSTGTVWQLVNPASANLFTPVFANGNFNMDMSTTTTTTIAHGLGRIPKVFRISWFAGYGASAPVVTGRGVYNGTTQVSSYIIYNTNGSTNGAGQTTKLVHYSYGGTSLDNNYNEGTASFDGTNLTITWAKTNSPTGTAYFTWEAEA